MGGGGGLDRWGVVALYQGAGGGTGGGYYLMGFFYLCFYPLVSFGLSCLVSFFK